MKKLKQVAARPQQKIADKMGIHQTRVGRIIEDFKSTLKFIKSDEKSNKTKGLKKSKAEITEAKIYNSEEELKEELIITHWGNAKRQ